MTHSFDLLSLTLVFETERPESVLGPGAAIDRAERALSEWAHVQPGSAPGTLEFWVRYRSGRSWLTRIYSGEVRAMAAAGRTRLVIRATLLPLMTIAGLGFIVVGLARDSLISAIALGVLFGVANYAILHLWLRSVLGAVVAPTVEQHAVGQPRG